jgi:hypothetical protein
MRTEEEQASVILDGHATNWVALEDQLIPVVLGIEPVDLSGRNVGPGAKKDPQRSGNENQLQASGPKT